MRKVFWVSAWFLFSFFLYSRPAISQGNAAACVQCLQNCTSACVQGVGLPACTTCLNGCQTSCQNVPVSQLPVDLQLWVPPSVFQSRTSQTTGPCPAGSEQAACEGCVNGGGAWTAFGCIDTDPSKFIAWLLKSIIGIAGGIAFLLILYGGFEVLTSGGDPEKLNNGKDIVVSAIAGVLMIVFSVLLLKIIGLDILHIPGF